MDFEDIVKSKLRELGADGLCLLEMDGCGCKLDDDFMPCGEPSPSCVAARVVQCTDACDHDADLDEHFEEWIADV
jgi:hypothetical protein